MFWKIFFILIIAPVVLFVSVLLFHVIAIGGIYTYKKSKANHALDSERALVASATPPPAKPAEPAATPASAAPVSPVSATPRTYVVKKGDNPAAIARSFGISSADLLALNQIEDPRKLRIGAVLKLPAGKAHAP
jgi:LysM repeat protein